MAVEHAEVAVQLQGEVTVTVRDARGRFVSRRAFRNTVSNYLLTALAGWLAATQVNTPNTGLTTVLPPDRIALGTGTATPAPADTVLGSETTGTRKVCSIKQVYGSYYAQFITQYQTGDPRGNFTEAGLFDAAGNLWAHVLLNLNLASGQIATVQWKIQAKVG